jgi:oxalate decarboxylase/phosphoglucose isomerase-like protein (cupin superfamily)
MSLIIFFNKAELNPGEILYVPPYWWHHVRAHSVSGKSRTSKEKQKKIGIELSNL